MKEPLYLEPLFPERSSGENLAVQLARRLRDAVESRELAAGTKLLGSRQLAKRLGLARNTVALAYEELTAQGYFETRVGAGTFVAAIGAGARAARLPQTSPRPARASRAASLRSHFGVARGSGALRPGVPDLSSFPHAAWTRSARRALDVYRRDLDYGASAGLRALQEAIATHVRLFRGVATQPEHVIVLEGAQAALHLAALVLAAPGDRVVLEDPCYVLARAAFEAYGLQTHGVAVDAAGIDVDRLPHEAKLVFVTPTHQFPLGGALPVARRLALLAWAKRCNAYILEDDYDSEFTSKTRPLPALQSLDREERVLYIGSFSKTLAPAIRLGYLILPPHLASAFRAARASTSLGVSLQLQATAADFIARGDFARHIRRMNAIYERRRALLAGTLRANLRSAFRIGPISTGLHVAVIGARGFADAHLATLRGADRYVALSALCVQRRDCSGALLGFANGSDAEIESGALRLAALANSIA
ncbi:MAG TPA: PLP-dependent aminotransferase family protein [Candidatus Cybelea sp.]|nr:PLP-dependent aminotransferase family protein [Candidatus Cybelea sp.]